ncbi:MFS transporter [Burkholderia anthina]|uniref:MFS transporter n=1 Tax=Burkholderia anthina TaxID=179879 RepID=UPI001CF3412B|nr:MFS transporter [Burkholderia anthina]MCA8094843.1 MFS transporter [Burkholderia anthina]
MNRNVSSALQNAPSGGRREQMPLSLTPSKRTNNKRVIVAASLGNALEMFDFTVFSFFSGIIGRQFFPVDNASGQLMLALSTFGVGFLARPLGGVLIGGYADRRGRKAALALTIGLMTLGTGLIATAPPYATLGIGAPLLVVIGRLLQGLSAGGEFGASTTYLMESGSVAGRGYMVSWQSISQGASILLGSLFGTLLTGLLSHAALESWGWRIPFAFGLLIGPVGLYIRRNLDETHRASSEEASPVAVLLRLYPGRILHGVLLLVGSTTGMYVMGYYLPSYAVRELHLPAATSLLSGCAAGVAMIIGGFISGQLTDRLKARKPFLCANFGAVLLVTYPIFALLNTYPSVPLIVGASFIMMLIGAVSGSAFILLLLESFPREVRVTGLSVVYAVGVTLFGGFAQFNVTWLLQVTRNPMSLAWYLVIASAISFAALILFRERKYRNE